MRDISNNITFIIPCFNCEGQINNCVDSILLGCPLAKIIIIDDGSTDNTYISCKEKYSKIHNVKIYKNSNHGVSYTRNFGIKKCETDYLFFVDADDLVICDELIDLLKKYDTTIDVTKFSFNIIRNKSTKKVIFKNENIVTKQSGCNKRLGNMFFQSSDYNMVWGQIIRTSLIKDHKVFFDENLFFAEDIDFNYRLYNSCKKIFLSRIIAYSYNNNCGVTKQFTYQILNKRIIDITYAFSKFIDYENLDSYLVADKFVYEIFPQIMRISEELKMEKWISYVISITERDDYKKIIQKFQKEKYNGKYQKIINYFLDSKYKKVYFYSKFMYCNLKKIQNLKNNLGW